MKQKLSFYSCPIIDPYEVCALQVMTSPSLFKGAIRCPGLRISGFWLEEKILVWPQSRQQKPSLQVSITSNITPSWSVCSHWLEIRKESSESAHLCLLFRAGSTWHVRVTEWQGHAITALLWHLWPSTQTAQPTPRPCVSSVWNLRRKQLSSWPRAAIYLRWLLIPPGFVTDLVLPLAASALLSPGLLALQFPLNPLQICVRWEENSHTTEKRPNTFQHMASLEMEQQPCAGWGDGGVISSIFL